MNSSLTLLYDGSFEGLLTAVFDGLSRRPPPGKILPERDCQIEWGRRYLPLSTDPIKAARVKRGIEQKIGKFAYETVWLAHLADLPDISTAIFRYLLWGFDQGESIRRRIADSRAIAVDKARTSVMREAGVLQSLLRLYEQENGVYYGEIGPHHDVLPLLMPYFVEQMEDRPFVVQDCTHRVAGIAGYGRWYLTSSGHFCLPDPTARDETACRLWGEFYRHITAKNSTIPAEQRMWIPPHYRRYWADDPSLCTSLKPCQKEPPFASA